MGTSADKLLYLQNTKIAIKDAIEAKGQEIALGTPFRDYASKIASISGGGGEPRITPYVRPSDWLTLPTVLETDEKFVGLHAIYERANFVALSAAGDYTVDWGDGVIENFTSGAIAQHEYNYATYDVANSTLCSRGYKQAIVTVTPQAGQHLTRLDLHQRHSSLAIQYSSGFLDIALSSQYLIDLRLSVPVPSDTTQTITFRDLEQVSIVKSDLSTMERLFFNCSGLLNVVDLASSSREARDITCSFTDTGDVVTAVAHGLRNNDTVVVKSVLTTTGITVANRYFVINATSDTFKLSTTYAGTSPVNLVTDGSGVLTYGTSFGSMFQSCYSLQTIPLIDTSSGTSFGNMFQNCYSLQTIPLIDTSSGTNFGSMFYGCYSLQTIPLLNTSSGTNFGNMFQSCYSLQTIQAKEFKVSFSVASCKLSAQALNEIYINLPTVTSKTITVTGNYGVTSDDPTIATAKGWTVTG